MTEARNIGRCGSIPTDNMQGPSRVRWLGIPWLGITGRDGFGRSPKGTPYSEGILGVKGSWGPLVEGIRIWYGLWVARPRYSAWLPTSAAISPPIEFARSGLRLGAILRKLASCDPQPNFTRGLTMGLTVSLLAGIQTDLPDRAFMAGPEMRTGSPPRRSVLGVETRRQTPRTAPKSPGHRGLPLFSKPHRVPIITGRRSFNGKKTRIPTFFEFLCKWLFTTKIGLLVLVA
jgi:hypothetical protein